MAKNKSFNFDSLVPEADTVQQPKASAPKSVDKETTSSPSAPSARTSATAMPAAAPQELGKNKNGQFTIVPKKRNDKMVSYKVNEEENTEFTKINKRLGYSNNEMICHLMSEFIKANKDLV